MYITRSFQVLINTNESNSGDFIANNCNKFVVVVQDRKQGTDQ